MIIPCKIHCFYVYNLTVVHLQIYVEIERARLIKRLANIKEEQGKIDEAADLMQEVAVSLHCTLELRTCTFIFHYNVSVIL
jgi:hypothetical protein